MSTRMNLVIEYGKTKVYIYRHMDGYPAEAGVDIAEKLKAAGNNGGKFLAALLSETYEQQSYQTAPSKVYELTTDLHGDIEWLYRVRFPEYGEGDVKVGCVGRKNFEDVNLLAPASLDTLESFVRLYVNPDIRAKNQRRVQLQKQNPGNPRYQSEPQSEVTL